jgi:ADP-ribosylglycohydrolase
MTGVQVLREAAEAAVLLTHPTDTAADAAAVLAAAIAWCMRYVHTGHAMKYLEFYLHY